MNKKTRSLIQYMTLTPYSIWAVVFIVVPLIFVAYYAFTDQNFHFTFDNINRFFTATSQIDDGETVKEVHTYLVIFMRSLKLAVISTVICLLMGYPLAYIMARATERTQSILMTLIMIPMWMNFLLRTYAWVTILSKNGILNSLLGRLGMGPADLLYTEGAVILGMVYNFLPFMILPIYTALEKMDQGLIEAAQDLGSNRLQTFTRVIFPLSLPGVLSGVSMVFIPAISTFEITALLGGNKTNLIGNVIEQQFTVTGDWNYGSALSVILMVFLVISLIFTREEDVQDSASLKPLTDRSRLVGEEVSHG